MSTDLPPSRDITVNNRADSQMSLNIGLTVLIVDDHPAMLRGMAALLQIEPWVNRVVEAQTVAAALTLAVTERPDVAAVDLTLGDSVQDGLYLIRELCRSTPACGVMVFTTTTDQSVVRECLAAGARGYVLKTSAPDAMLSALRTVAHGGLVLGPGVRAQTVAESNDRALPAPLDRLSARDVQVLTLLGEVNSNLEIARALGITEKTVRNRVSGLLATLGVADRAKAGRVARENGLTSSAKT